MNYDNDLPSSQGSVKSEYTAEVGYREHFCDRARAAADVTIPSLFPRLGSNGTTAFRPTYSTIGASALNNLASKLMLALLPANTPFFQLTVDQADINAMGLDAATKGQLDEQLVNIEGMISSRLETKLLRPSLSESIKQLLISGNSLLYIGDEVVKQYKLTDYIVKRDGLGRVKTIIARDFMDKEDVPHHMKQCVQVTNATDSNDRKGVEVYTKIYIEKGMNGEEDYWMAHQEYTGHIDPESHTTYPIDKCPWIPLRMVQVTGENYGRGYVEEYIGTLKSVEVLTKAIEEGTVAAARIVYLLNPAGVTKRQPIINAPNGGIVNGRPQDIAPMQLNKANDFNIARQRIQEETQQIAAAFLMNQAVQRNAERVTAEEIRIMTQELETVLGGVYSLLSTELQIPLVNVMIGELMRDELLPPLPKGTLKPQVLTGLSALGRNQELEKLQALFNLLAPLGPEVLSENMKLPEYISRVCASLQLDSKNLVPSVEEREFREKEKQAKQQYEVAMQMMQAQQAQGGQSAQQPQTPQG